MCGGGGGGGGGGLGGGGRNLKVNKSLNIASTAFSLTSSQNQ